VRTRDAPEYGTELLLILLWVAGMRTTAGSYALLNSVPFEDATVVAKLRAAGAIILGKTTMSELASYKASDLRQGWSALGGQGQSAYVAGGYFNGGDAEGSSSGSAISVSAVGAPAALGTETAGSLITPSGRAALYTLRSSVGLVSRYGAIPASKELDTVGPMTKSAYDTALLLGCMIGYDPSDPASTHTSPSYFSMIVLFASHVNSHQRVLP
jgi:amidase